MHLLTFSSVRCTYPVLTFWHLPVHNGHKPLRDAHRKGLPTGARSRIPTSRLRVDCRCVVACFYFLWGRGVWMGGDKVTKHFAVFLRTVPSSGMDVKLRSVGARVQIVNSRHTSVSTLKYWISFFDVLILDTCYINALCGCTQSSISHSTRQMAPKSVTLSSRLRFSHSDMRALMKHTISRVTDAAQCLS